VYEETILPLAVKTVAEAADVPICIDAADHEALAAALAVCPGKPLVAEGGLECGQLGQAQGLCFAQPVQEPV